MDRHLEEALAYRADPRHLAAVFEVDEKTALRLRALRPAAAHRHDRALRRPRPRTGACLTDALQSVRRDAGSSAYAGAWYRQDLGERAHAWSVCGTAAIIQL
jgi:hypothetical protein